jgi:ABC-type Fe3+/spermidine/putrescine transport system ATPase subunit
LLKIVGGLVQTDSGKVLFEGTRVEGPLETLIPGHPGIAYLSQHFELRNNYRVEEVLSYANTLTDDEANTLFEVCRISHLVKRKTHQLSGGEKQRIALARLLISSPRLLLLDEPYSNLDLIHKNILKAVINEIGERLKITCMLVSHDPLDMLSWADEILVLKNGKVIQQASPHDIYNKPVNEYVAGLLGNYNVFDTTQQKLFSIFPGVEIKEKKMLIRPENFRIIAGGPQALKTEIKKVNFLGSVYELELSVSGVMVTIRTSSSQYSPEQVIYVHVAADDVWYLEE